MGSEKQRRRLCPSLFKEDNEEREAEPTRWGKSQHTCCPTSIIIIQDERTRPRHTFIRLYVRGLSFPAVMVNLQLSIQPNTKTLTMSGGMNVCAHFAFQTEGEKNNLGTN